MSGFIDDSDNGTGSKSVAPAGTYSPSGAVAMTLNIPANAHPDFRFLYHPLRWGWCHDGWLPLLRKFVLEAGVDNVDKDGDPTNALHNEARAGWELVPLDVLPVAIGATSHGYIVPYPAQRGTAHLTPWHKVKVLGGQVFLSNDDAGYRAWIRKVVELRGWKLDPDVLEVQREKLATELSEEMSKPAGNETARLRAANLQRILDQIDGKPAKKVKRANPTEGTDNE